MALHRRHYCHRPHRHAVWGLVNYHRDVGDWEGSKVAEIWVLVGLGIIHLFCALFDAFECCVLQKRQQEIRRREGGARFLVVSRGGVHFLVCVRGGVEYCIHCICGSTEICVCWKYPFACSGWSLFTIEMLI
ncbi:hypothetical protein BDZ45DRAFT_250094 [Acephala macrosclerotiorum]|nr:hypothetical protein BDZ45DRAFT_250094 [Acephala macrosclerotiorum]